MTPREFEKICKNRTLSGCYLFCGEEEQRKSECLFAARRALFEEGDDPLNRVVLTPDGRDLFTALAEQIASLPFFSDRKLVEVHSVNYMKLPKSQLETLEMILQTLSDHEECVVILYAENAELAAYRTAKKKSEAFETLEGCLTPVFFERAGHAELRDRLLRLFSENGVAVSPSTAESLIDYCSEDLLVLLREADKLICYTRSTGRNAVDPADIQRVCCGKRIFGAYDFTDALMAGNPVKAYRILKELKDRKEAPQNIMGSIIDLIGNMLTVRTLVDAGRSKAEIARLTGMHEYPVEKYMNAVRKRSAARLKKALDVCMDADLKIKSSSLDDYLVLDKLVIRMSRV